MLVVAEVWLSHALPPSRRYFEKRIYEDPKDVDALCSFACFLQIVRKQDERAALMYASALEADPQVTLSGLRKAFCPKSPSEWRQKTGDQEEQGGQSRGWKRREMLKDELVLAMQARERRYAE